MKQGGSREARTLSSQRVALRARHQQARDGFASAFAGFTIVETLIVMAVTGVLFLAAVVLISGRSAKTQFTTASNDLKQELQQVINETSSGYFPNSGNFTCRAGINTFPTLANGSQRQGTNGDCMFLGKVVQFGATDAADKLLVYAVAGNRLQSGTKQEVTTLAQSFPVAIAPGVSNNSALGGITDSTPLENGLSVGSMTYSGGNTTSGFAVLSTFATYTASGSSCNGVCSGSQGLTLYAIANSAVKTASSKEFVDILDATPAGVSFVPTSSVTVCLNSGTTNQSAVYTIGANGNSQSVDMKVQSGACS